MHFLGVLLGSALLYAEGGSGSDWRTYGGTYNAWRYSELAQIHSGNVKRMVPAWVFQTGDYEHWLQATPIVVDGVVYLSTSSARVFALDGATGKVIWNTATPDEERDTVRQAEPGRRGRAGRSSSGPRRTSW